jgi:hypothetical protein
MRKGQTRVTCVYVDSRFYAMFFLNIYLFKIVHSYEGQHDY